MQIGWGQNSPRIKEAPVSLTEELQLALEAEGGVVSPGMWSPGAEAGRDCCLPHTSHCFGLTLPFSLTKGSDLSVDTPHFKQPKASKDQCNPQVVKCSEVYLKQMLYAGVQLRD